jgi:hypothetical protein
MQPISDDQVVKVLPTLAEAARADKNTAVAITARTQAIPNGTRPRFRSGTQRERPARCPLRAWSGRRSEVSPVWLPTPAKRGRSERQRLQLVEAGLNLAAAIVISQGRPPPPGNSVAYTRAVGKRANGSGEGEDVVPLDRRRSVMSSDCVRGTVGALDGACDLDA